MKRHELEHVIRAAGSITGSPEIIVIGSQAVLATLTSGPQELFVSREADVFVDQRPDLSDLIDGSIGELSPFDQTFGYYAHGVAEETPRYPPAGGIGSYISRTPIQKVRQGFALRFMTLPPASWWPAERKIMSSS